MIQIISFSTDKQINIDRCSVALTRLTIALDLIYHNITLSDDELIFDDKSTSSMNFYGIFHFTQFARDNWLRSVLQ